MEQKDYSIVRHAIGYARLETEQQRDCPMELSWPLGLFTNVFQPSVNLVKKTRRGSIVTKVYDKPQTPLQRLLLDSNSNHQTKRKLLRLYRRLNPAQLRREISKSQNRLNTLCDTKQIQKQRKRTNHLDSILR